MIKQLIFTVSTNTDVDDDVIFCNRLVFVGPHPQLVIRPKKGALPGAQRLLKIVAETIDTQLASDPEITYNLADDFYYVEPVPGGPETQVPVSELPVGNTGLDPETPATPGRKGISDFEHFPLPPDFPLYLASPNFDPALDLLHYIGAYPKALDGGDGKPGARGEKGVDGSNAPILEIWTKEIVGNNLTIDLRGQEGGHGGKGGIGQYGGNGQAGSIGVPTIEVDWLGAETICKQGPGLGGDGGRGGDAGCGGDGGHGGNGGVVKLFYVNGVVLTKLTPPMIEKGKGGKSGPAGTPGKGGKSGPAGANVPPCTPALSSSGGPEGNDCPRSERHQGGIAQDGDDGLDGYFVKYKVTNIPKI